MATEPKQEATETLSKGVASLTWKDRLPLGLNFRRASAPASELQTCVEDSMSTDSGLTGKTLCSEPAGHHLVHSNSMPTPVSERSEEFLLSRLGVRIQTTKANLSSGFPYTNELFELRISPNSWSEFSEEVVKATKLSMAQKTLIIGASVGVGLGTGILSSSYLSLLGVAPAMIAGKVLYDKQVTRKVKQGLANTEEGGLNSILRKWNEEVFIKRGFFIVLEVPEEAEKKEKARKATEKEEEKAKERELKAQDEEEKGKEKALLKEAQKLLKEQKKLEKKLKKENAKIQPEVGGDAFKEVLPQEGFMSDPELEPSTTRDLQDKPTRGGKEEKKKKKKKVKKFKHRFQVVLLPSASLPCTNLSQLCFIHAYEPVPPGVGERESYYKSQDHIEYYPVEPTENDPVPLLDSTPSLTPDLSAQSPMEPRGRIVSEIYTSPVLFYGNDDNSQSTFFPTPRMSTTTLTALNVDSDTATDAIPEDTEPAELPTPEATILVASEKEKKSWSDRFSRKKKDVEPYGLALDLPSQ